MASSAIPMCKVCQESETVTTPNEAKLLATVTLSYGGGTKATKWIPVCEQHYNGGPVFLLAEIPASLFRRQEETPRKG